MIVSSHTVCRLRSNLHGLSDLQHVVLHPLLILGLKQVEGVGILYWRETNLSVSHLLDLPELPLPLLELCLLPGSPLVAGLPARPGAVLPLYVEGLVAPVTEVVPLVLVDALGCQLVTEVRLSACEDAGGLEVTCSLGPGSWCSSCGKVFCPQRRLAPRGRRTCHRPDTWAPSPTYLSSSESHNISS